MKPQECFESDTEMLKEMLLEHVKDNEIMKKEVSKFINGNNYPELGEIRDYFIKKVVEMKWKDDLDKNQRLIKKLSIMIAKNENKVNFSEWEQKVEHAKERVRIEDVVRYYLKADNLRRRVKCPFHIGNSNHLQVYPKTNSFHCFSCKASGKPIDFVMKIENCDFKEAVDKMQYL